MECLESSIEIFLGSIRFDSSEHNHLDEHEDSNNQHDTLWAVSDLFLYIQILQYKVVVDISRYNRLSNVPSEEEEGESTDNREKI